ncbi:MAG: hypothetical protein HY264_05435, partial [Chloroflexi bacterium]|nr:hypothetical protein [Chloroflexota bacterium]
SALASRSWRLATVEIATRGSVAALLGEGLGERLAAAHVLAAPAATPGDRFSLEGLARTVRATENVDVVLAVRATTRGADMAVSIAVVDPRGSHRERRLAFLGGAIGRSRAALLAAAVLHERLR